RKMPQISTGGMPPAAYSAGSAHAMPFHARANSGACPSMRDYAMKKRILAGSAFALLLSLPAFAATDLHVSINLGNAPPPPVVVVQHRPHTVWLPEQRVYVVNDPDFDYDYFQVGAYWYV